VCQKGPIVAQEADKIDSREETYMVIEELPLAVKEVEDEAAQM
jgi:hypothetical protein